MCQNQIPSLKNLFQDIGHSGGVFWMWVQGTGGATDPFQTLKPSPTTLESLRFMSSNWLRTTLSFTRCTQDNINLPPLITIFGCCNTKKNKTASIYIYFCGGEMLSCVTAQSIVRSENGQALRWTMWRRCSVGQSGSLWRNGRGDGNPSLSRGRNDQMVCLVDLPHLKRVT